MEEQEETTKYDKIKRYMVLPDSLQGGWKDLSFTRQRCRDESIQMEVGVFVGLKKTNGYIKRYMVLRKVHQNLEQRVIRSAYIFRIFQSFVI